jgi:lipase ATG15
VYLGLGTSGTIFMLVILVFLAYPSFDSLRRLMKVGKRLINARNTVRKDAEEASKSLDDEECKRLNDPKASHAVYLVNEIYRINRPTNAFCWTIFTLEVAFFYVWPMGSIYSVGNWPLATLFMIVVGITGLRYYLNAAIVLEETGTLDVVKASCEESLWRKQSRLNEIVGNITRGKSRPAWTLALGVFAFAFVGLFLATVGLNQETSFDQPFTYVSDFEYQQPEDSIRYPTCEITSDLGASPLKTMADYAFLAGLAYRSDEATQPELDGWFGNSGIVALDQNETVAEYRAANNVTSEVSFKLVTIPGAGNFAYVLIRGTQNNWDMLTDAQLWGAAILMQVVRALLPLGEMWTPIIDQLIKAITTIESESIERVCECCCFRSR